MFSNFDEEAQKILLMSKKEMNNLCHPYVGSEHLLLAILHNSKLGVTKFLNEYGINYDIYKEEIIKVIGIGTSSNSWFLFTPLLKRIIENAVYDSKDEDSSVTVEKLFISLLEVGDGVANRILMGMNIDIDFLYEKYIDKYSFKNFNMRKKIFLDEFAVNLNEVCKSKGFDSVIDRDDYINRLIEILLRRTKNNPLLIGDAGVGKTAIVEELVRRIVNKDVPEKLKNYTVFSVTMSSLIAGTKYRGEFEERINKLISELEFDEHIILFIDEIHTLVGAGGAEGAIDASNILKPYLARGKIKIIGATTNNEYLKYIEKEKALDRRFQKVYVSEPDSASVKNILLSTKHIYESYHNVVISDKIIELIIEMSLKYLNIGFFPDKAIDLLDEACCKAVILDTKAERRLKKYYNNIKEFKTIRDNAIIAHDYKLATNYKKKLENLESKINCYELNNFDKTKYVTEDNVYDVIYDKTKIPIKDIISLDSKKIFTLLSDKIIGQKSAISQILEYLFNGKKSVLKSCFLVGNSGVGKTYFVKEFAKLLYPLDAFIRIDMSEFKESHTISKIIGSPPGYVGYNDNNCLLMKVKQNPYCIILLDEIEKAHPDVLRLFLQVLDDSRMTSSYGEVIDFSHATLFMTSNIGTIQSEIGFENSHKTEHFKKKIKEFLGIEFLNRIGLVVVFDKINSFDIDKIIKKKLKDYGIDNPSLEIIEKIKKESEFENYGVRKIDKLIDKYEKKFIIFNR